MKIALSILLLFFVTGCPSTGTWEHRSGEGIVRGGIPSMGEPTYVVRPSCAIGLKSGLMKLPFVRTIHVNYKTGITQIYQEYARTGWEALDKQRITKAIEDSGYKVDKFLK